MKLSKLYSNQTDKFDPIVFTEGLNVVMAEIRLPENRKKDTHNLGKTTLGKIIDFCLLSSRDNRLFLFKHHDIFKCFTFFLEIEIIDGMYLTIKRNVEEHSKISFKKHKEPRQNFLFLSEHEWDHSQIPLERAKELLDGLLDLRAVKPWDFRKGLGYLLRSQDDYGDVFHLKKFAGAHSGWKPFLAHLLGFNVDLINQHYKKEEDLERKKAEEKIIKSELSGSIDDASKVEGILLLKQEEVEKKQGLLDAFDFRAPDKQKTKELVDDINEKIAKLNAERYSLSQNRKKIIASIEDEQILFNPDEAERLFKEVGVFFQGQIKKDYVQLVAFNKAITEERRLYLLEEKTDIESELKCINSELNELGKRRSDVLSFLSDTEIFSKYKHVSDELVTLKADITSLERQRQFLNRLQELRTDIRSLTEEKNHIQTQIEIDVNKQNSDSASLFSKIRLYFNEIIEEVINRKAVLTVTPNKEGHLDFKAEILDDSGNATSADHGYTYRKLLCVAFDMALLRAHLAEKFPRFVFHDGVLESLDDRKKENLISIIRHYAGMGLQQVITLIDSDLPPRTNKTEDVFSNDEIVLCLHDEGDSGRLFKIKSW